ncbi:MAG: ABC transporter permease [Thermoanaerobaculia bacterium]
MDFVWSSAVKDLRRRLRDPVGLILWLGIPFVVLSLLLLAFGGSGNVKPRAHLLVVDQDDSFLSGLLVGAFGQGEMSELFDVETVELEEGRETLGRGDASALLVIPEGFGHAVLNRLPTTLELSTNPAQRILPGLVEETLEIVVEGVFYAHRLLGDELDTVASLLEGETELSTAVLFEMSGSVQELVSHVSGYLLPEPVLSLESTVEADEHAGAGHNFGALFFQGMFFMAIVFMAQGLSDDVWKERAQGTLRRLVTTPQAVAKVLAGKLLAAMLIYIALAVLVLPIGAWLYDFSFAWLPVAAIWVAFSGLLLLVLFTLLQLFAPSQRAGSILSSLVLFPLIMIGGNFFPLELMPAWLAAIGRRTPNGWALEQLKAILAGAARPEALAAAFAGLAVTGALAFLLGSWRIRRGFASAP